MAPTTTLLAADGLIGDSSTSPVDEAAAEPAPENGYNFHCTDQNTGISLKQAFNHDKHYYTTASLPSHLEVTPEEEWTADGGKARHWLSSLPSAPCRHCGPQGQLYRSDRRADQHKCARKQDYRLHWHGLFPQRPCETETSRKSSPRRSSTTRSLTRSEPRAHTLRHLRISSLKKLQVGQPCTTFISNMAARWSHSAATQCPCSIPIYP